MPYYFAYGSNMSPQQMAARCPGARALGSARLEGWRFHITTRGTASILPHSERAVHGVLWRCSYEHVHTLDRFEGVAWRNYFRRHVAVEISDGRSLRALTYVSARRYPGVARANYMLTRVIPAAMAFDLPKIYLAELESWLTARPIADRKAGYRGRKTPTRAPR